MNHPVVGHNMSLTLAHSSLTVADESSLDAVEVKVIWGGDVVRVAHVTSGGAFTLGDSGCSFALPRETVGAARLPLVRGHGGRLWLTLPVGASGSVCAKGEGTRTVADLIATGEATPSREVSGAHEIALEAGSSAWIELVDAHVAFELAHVRAGKRAPMGLLASIDAQAHAYTGMSALMHGALIASLAFFLPAMKGSDGETIDRDEAAAMAPYLSAIAEREREPHDEPAKAEDTSEGGGAKGAAASQASGTLGSAEAPARSDARYAVRGTPDNTDPHLARERALLEVETFGMIAVLSGSRENAPITPWGQTDASGRDPKSALGNMWGVNLDDAFGTGGLGPSGAGIGGGGTCDGCVGLDSVGVLGHDLGDGPGRGPGIGHGHGVLPSTYTPKGIRMRVGDSVVTGGQIPAEVIQRIVRQNFGRFRMCYEDGLRVNPALGGRVAVKFIIDRQGAVSLASDAGSDLPDQRVIACVVRGFQNLSFPEPKGGIAKVTYPIVFTPGE
jgi:hypothetical protein